MDGTNMKIKELPYNYIEEYELKKKCGVHSQFFCRMVINEDSKNILLNFVGKTITVLYTENEVDYSVFNGIVKEVSVDSSIHQYSADILAYSSSIQEDEEKEFRIFQSPDNTYGMILDEGRLGIKNCKLALPELSEKKYPLVALQNKETNFTFIKRLADATGFKLWVDDTEFPNKICIQNELIKSSTIVKSDEILSIRYSRKNKYNKNIKYAKITLHRYINFGRKITFEEDNDEYVVVALKSYFKNGIEVFEYTVEECVIFEERYIKEEFTRLKGKVKSHDDPEKMGRIKVEFVEKKLIDIDKNNPRWIAYMTGYTGKNSGLVFVPDPGDYVDVVFYNGVCYAVESERYTKLNSECENVKEK